MGKTHQTCGVALMRLLQNYGTDVIFGIPGVHTLELYRGIAEVGIQHVTPRHEQSAGFMADGYGPCHRQGRSLLSDNRTRCDQCGHTNRTGLF